MPKRGSQAYIWQQVKDWREMVAELVGENALFAGEDGWFSCFFCDGEGSWDASGADHELDCAWINARAALALSSDGEET